MIDKEYKYDLAISFLNQDEAIALDLHNRLSLNFDVFVYSKKQEELAGSDGIESFRSAFISEARMVVVLYRKGWGETPWTRVEEGAITDRFLNEGWDWLLFIMLDSKSSPPPWLPNTRIRFNLEEYGIEQAVGAIKVRLQEIGSEMQRETATKRAKLVESQIAFRKEKERLFSSIEGMKAFEAEFNSVQQEIKRIVDEISKDTEGIKIECGGDLYNYVVTNDSASISVIWRPRYANDLHESPLRILEFNSKLLLPHLRRLYIQPFEPKEIGSYSFDPDVTSDLKCCWRANFSDHRQFSSSEVADYILRAFINLIDKLDRGNTSSKV